MLNRKIETTFAPTGNLVPAVWQGRTAPFHEGTEPKKAKSSKKRADQETKLPKKLAPTVKLSGDTPKLTAGETSRQHRWQILQYLRENAEATAKELAANVKTGNMHKRLASLLARGYIIVVKKSVGNRILNHYSLKPEKLKC